MRDCLLISVSLYVLWLRKEIGVLRAGEKRRRLLIETNEKFSNSSAMLIRYRMCERRLTFLEARFRFDWHGQSAKANDCISPELRWRMTMHGKALWQGRKVEALEPRNSKISEKQVGSKEIFELLNFEGLRPIWTQKLIDTMLELPTLSPQDYPHSAEDLYMALRYVLKIRHVAVFSALTPWVELTIWQVFPSAQVTTVEYNVPIIRNLTSHNFRLRSRSQVIMDYTAHGAHFDGAVFFSGLEHDGLGRYGDPVDPDGDIAALREIALMLRPKQFLFLAIPIGPLDHVHYYAHRIYGPYRLRKLIASSDFDLVARVWNGKILPGSSLNDDIYYSHDNDLPDWQYQPILILQRKRLLLRREESERNTLMLSILLEIIDRLFNFTMIRQ